MTNIFARFSARQAAAYVGFGSVAMIDYLQRSGVFFPRRMKGRRGRGRERKYEFRDLLVLKAIKKLLDAGASVANLKVALREFQTKHWSADPGMLEDGNGAIRFLVASAGKVYLARDANVLIDLSQSGQLAFSFIIDLDRLHGELRDALGLPSLHGLQSELFVDGGSNSALT